MLEKEMKSMLSEQQFLMLEKQFVWQKKIENINHYYEDNYYTLRRNGNTVRIREFGNNKILQVKFFVGNEGSLHIKNEYDKEVYGIPPHIDSIELSALTGVNLPHVEYVGFLKTERKEYKLNDNIVCLDKNYYLGAVDYELEVEFETEVNCDIINAVNSVGVVFTGIETKGKYQRFAEKRIIVLANNGIFDK